MKLSKKIVFLIISAILITFSTVVNAEGNVDALENFITSTHTVCGKSYELDSTEKQKFSDYIKNGEITEETAESALSKLNQAQELLNTTNMASISEETKQQAVSLIVQAGSDIGLTVSINRSANPKTVSVKDKSGTALLSTTYTLDTEGNPVFNKNGSSSSGGSDSTSSNTYKVVSGSGQTYYLNSGKDLIFKIDADYALFENGGKVYMDNVEISTDKYTASSGSTLISLKSDYVNTLRPGSHNLNVEFNTGRKVPASFTVALASSPTTTGGTTTSNTTSTTTNGGTNTNTTSTSGTTNKTNTNSTTATNTSNTNATSNVASNTTNTSTQATNTNTAKTFAYTGNNNGIKLLISLLAVVAVATIYIRKIYGK